MNTLIPSVPATPSAAELPAANSGGVASLTRKETIA